MSALYLGIPPWSGFSVTTVAMPGCLNVFCAGLLAALGSLGHPRPSPWCLIVKNQAIQSEAPFVKEFKLLFPVQRADRRSMERHGAWLISVDPFQNGLSLDPFQLIAMDPFEQGLPYLKLLFLRPTQTVFPCTGININSYQTWS